MILTEQHEALAGPASPSAALRR